MEIEELNREKSQILSEIMELREELKDISGLINEIGSSVSFIHFVIIPILIATIVTVIMRFVGPAYSKSLGTFVIIFILALAASTIYNKNKVAKRKKELVSKRLKLQKRLVKKSQRLSEIENELKA